MSKQSTTDLMKAIASGLDDILNGTERPKKTGFVVLVFPFDGPEGQRVNYVSNAERADMRAALKEISARFDGQADVRGKA